MTNLKNQEIELRRLLPDDHSTIPIVNELVWEYLQWGNNQLMLHYGYEMNTDEMLSTFTSELPMYCLENTRLYALKLEDRIIGLGGYKMKDAKTVELKRVYIQAQHRGKGFGRKLVTQLVADAKHLGFESVYLESAGFMDEAYELYKSLGFTKIPNYSGIETPQEFASNIYCIELRLSDFKPSIDA